MANWSDRNVGVNPQSSEAARAGAREVAYDAGLRSYMLRVYNYMASGVLLTGIVAMLFARGGDSSPAFQLFSQGGILAWLVILAPLAFVLVMSFGMNRLSTGALHALFWAFAVAMGLSLSTVFLTYTQTSIAQTFFATSAAFVSLSLWGYTTKKDLSGWGTFLLMGLVGLIVAMVINMFLQSTTAGLVISALGVLIFAGLTAYDTQRIKSVYFQVAGHGEAMAKATIMGALNLYLDFINMFLFLLQFMGGRE
ncbi:MAG: Bax inhibitor-1 family protein [Parasphingopyxis sp.]|nr:Bax inhibitor-1/YccA family protein [Sphingomonadales bacterium]